MVRSGIYRIVPERDLAKLDDRVLRLPEWRCRKALSYQRAIDRLQCVLAYDLLEALLLDAFGLNLRDHEIVYDEMGKPSLPGYPDCHFSLGHCPAGVIAVVADCPVGCDIEEIRRPYEENCREIEEYCFSAAERKLVAESKDPATEFTRVWTVKEALFKLDNRLQLESLDTTATTARISVSAGVDYVASVVLNGYGIGQYGT